MTNNKNESNPKTVTSKLSVHVVFYSCPDCGDEVEHIEFCSKCDKEMGVIDVVQKFGSEAQEIIEKLKALTSLQKEENEEESPNIIIISEDDEEIVNGSDDDENTITEEEVLELDDIFEDSDERASDNSVDISDLTSKLDESDEENTFDDLDIDPEDLPEL
jgi:predicted RNA-binding Zn-ribbon protein involved in translation (DUF1610 family)